MDWAGACCEKEGTHKTSIAVVAFLPPPPPFLEAWEGGGGGGLVNTRLKKLFVSWRWRWKRWEWPAEIEILFFRRPVLDGCIVALVGVLEL